MSARGQVSAGRRTLKRVAARGCLGFTAMLRAPISASAQRGVLLASSTTASVDPPPDGRAIVIAARDELCRARRSPQRSLAEPPTAE
jgi:hypothetical protein